jgi:hypothetical protein
MYGQGCGTRERTLLVSSVICVPFLQLSFLVQQLHPSGILQLPHRIPRPPQIHLNRPQPRLLRKLQINTNIIQEQRIPRRNRPHTPALRDLVQLPHRQLIRLRIGFPHADSRGAEAHVKQRRDVFRVVGVGTGWRWMYKVFSEEHAFVVEDIGRESDVVAKRAEHEAPALLKFLKRWIHVRIWRAAELHHAPEEALRVDVRHALAMAIDLPAVDGLASTSASPPALFDETRKVFLPDFWAGELRLEGCEPFIVELDFAPFDELPCAGVVWAFLDGVVDVAVGYLVLDFVVEDRLEGAEDLWGTGQISFMVVKTEGSYARLHRQCRTGWLLEALKDPTS